MSREKKYVAGEKTLNVKTWRIFQKQKFRELFFNACRSNQEQSYLLYDTERKLIAGLVLLLDSS